MALSPDVALSYIIADDIVTYIILDANGEVFPVSLLANGSSTTSMSHVRMIS